LLAEVEFDEPSLLGLSFVERGAALVEIASDSAVVGIARVTDCFGFFLEAFPDSFGLLAEFSRDVAPPGSPGVGDCVVDVMLQSW